MYDARYAEEQEAKYNAALADTKPTGLVLDVGCGTGLFFSHPSTKATGIVGIDTSKGLLHHARGRAKRAGNAALVQGDADHLPFVNHCFDAAFAFTVLQNMPKPLETLMEIHRTTRDGGAVVVTGLKKAFSPKALLQLLGRAGFQAVSVRDDEGLKCYVASTLKKG